MTNTALKNMLKPQAQLANKHTFAGLIFVGAVMASMSATSIDASEYRAPQPGDSLKCSAEQGRNENGECAAVSHERLYKERALYEALRDQKLNRDLNVIKMLIEAQPDAVKKRDMKQYNRWTALHIAAMRGASKQVVEFILDAHPAAASSSDKIYGAIPLHLALQNKALTGVVKLLLNAYPEAAAIPDKTMNLPLKMAVEAKAPKGVLKLLLSAFPDGAKKLSKSERKWLALQNERAKQS